MACTTADADEMIAAAAAHRRRARAVPQHALRGAVRGRAASSSPPAGSARSPASAPRSGTPARRPGRRDAEWFFDAAQAGGGCLIDLGVHVDRPGSLRHRRRHHGGVGAAQRLPRRRRRPTRSCSRALSGGAIGTIHASWSSPSGPDHQLTVIGTRRHAASRQPHSAHLHRRPTANASGSRCPTRRAHRSRSCSPRSRGERAPSVTAADGRAAVAVVQAAYRSAAHALGDDGGRLMPGFEAGFGTAIITPPTPVQLAGFIDDQPATEVHDDLEVRALFLHGEHGGVCLLVCDLLGLSPRFAEPDSRRGRRRARSRPRRGAHVVHPHPRRAEHARRQPSPRLDHPRRLPSRRWSQRCVAAALAARAAAAPADVARRAAGRCRPDCRSTGAACRTTRRSRSST